MSSERRIATCTNCGDEREVAAHGLCFKCYRASERAAENPWAAADRNNRAKLRAQKRLRTAITTILNAVDNVIEVMDEEHVTAIRGVCRHYLLGLASCLPTAPKTVGDVNSEHAVAVTSSQETQAGDVNSEQEPSVNCSQPLMAPDDAELDETCIHDHTDGYEVGPDDRYPKDIKQQPLVYGNYYRVLASRRGGFGVCEPPRKVFLQWHATSLGAWDAIAAANTRPA